jgi:3-dehydroquinate synthase
VAVIRVHLPDTGPPSVADGQPAPTGASGTAVSSGADSPATVGSPATDRSYDIVCGRDLLAMIGPVVAAAGGRRAVLICDAAIAATHGSRVAATLLAAGVELVRIEVPSGEASKSVAGASRLWEACAAACVDRSTHVVAVGGGVTGDLAGFVAATFARGLPVWQVPTTLVAQVDSAIGGKTGINLAAGKNLVGAFWQPRGVFADIDTLATLPAREFVSGLAEVAKYGMIFDPDFFSWLETSAELLLARDPAAVEYAVERSAALKGMVVERDERETRGLRAALNYGHTFAHAYETALGYGTVLHGEAVAIGMARAARLACSLARISPEAVIRQDRLLERLGLPISAAAWEAATPRGQTVSPELLLDIMARDKKSVGGQLRFVLPDRIGRVELVAGIDPLLVSQCLAD